MRSAEDVCCLDSAVALECKGVGMKCRVQPLFLSSFVWSLLCKTFVHSHHNWICVSSVSGKKGATDTIGPFASTES